MKQFDLMAFGEVLLRLSPIENERITKCTKLNTQVGGAELNVVSGVSQLGLNTAIISKLPKNDLGTFAKNSIGFCGVSDKYLAYDSDTSARLGTYYYEYGAYPRKPSVTYDRQNSSFGKVSIQDFSSDIFFCTKMFHTSGITLALSKQAQETAIGLIKELHSKFRVKISFDVNYRANLWSEDDARECITKILPFVDIFFCSEDTARLTFKKKGTMKSIMKEFCEEYSISIIASTKRIAHSPKCHTFTSIIYNYNEDKFYEEEPYKNIDVIDRIGSGDAYVSGVLYGLLKYNFDCMKALEIGNATSALKNTIIGDMLCSNITEIENIIQEHNSSGYHSEITR